MASREEQLLSSVEDYLQQHTNETVSRIMADFDDQFGQILDEFHQVIKTCSEQTIRQQTDSDKGKLKYIIISFLNSSVITQTYDLQVDFYDDRMYLDENTATGYWRPGFMVPYLKLDDINTLQTLFSQKVTRVMDYEMLELQYGFIGILSSLYPHFCAKLIQHSRHLLCEVEKEDEIPVLFGIYMESAPYITILHF